MVRSSRATFWGEKVRYWEEVKEAYKEKRVRARLWRAEGEVGDAMDTMSSLGRDDRRLGILGICVVVLFGKNSFLCVHP